MQGQSFPNLPSTKSVHYPSSGSNRGRHFINPSSSSVLATNAPAEVGDLDPYIGKKVWTKWPEDNHFYEAVITDYNAAEVCLRPYRCQNFSLYTYILHILSRPNVTGYPNFGV